jgi:hypothetical protein
VTSPEPSGVSCADYSQPLAVAALASLLAIRLFERRDLTGA